MAVRIDPEHNERFALQMIRVRFTGARVLEIGCGDGRLTRAIALEARSVVAIDTDAAAVADLRRTAPANVEAVTSGFESFEPRGAFDAVVFSWSL
jgi:16S rRNA A1518/A1519 N6-dimethyltransferase RsmA/KsgA/DIM1 with predicted DNA glycosylase/AP lyase activity